MKKTKRLLSLLLAIVMLLGTVGQLVACGGGGETTDSGNEDNGGSNGKKSYVIEVVTNGKRALKDVEVVIYNEDGFIASRNTTDKNGRATFELEEQNYTVSLGGLAEGYNCEESYELPAGGLKIVVSTEVIKDESIDFGSVSAFFMGVNYKAVILLAILLIAMKFKKFHPIVYIGIAAICGIVFGL